MKIALIALFLSFLFTPMPAYAVDPACLEGGPLVGTEYCANQTDDDSYGSNAFVGPDGIITRVTQLLIVVVGVASVFMVMIGGFLFITSSGDPGRTAHARSMIIYALVGVAIAALSQFIVVFVLSKL